MSRVLERVPLQIFSLIAISLLAHVTMSGGRVAAQLFALKHEGSPMLAGVAYSLYGLMPALLSLHMGRWIDRVGTRHVMRIALIANITGLALPVFSPTLPAVLLAATICGFGFASYMLAANVCVSYMDFKDEADRVGMIAWLQMGNSISNVVGPLIVGTLIDHHSFSAAFGGLALIVLASFITSTRVSLPDGTRHRAEKGKQDSILKAVLADPYLIRIYVLNMATSLSFDGFNAMVPMLGDEMGYSATQIAGVLSAFAAGTFTIRALLPWLSRKLGEWRMLCLAFAIGACVFFSLPLAKHLLLLSALGFVFGLAAGVGQPNILSLIYRAMPPGRAGEGAGLRAMAGNIMGLTGPSTYGAIVALFGVAPVFIVVGSILSVSSWQASVGGKRLPATIAA